MYICVLILVSLCACFSMCLYLTFAETYRSFKNRDALCKSTAHFLNFCVIKMIMIIVMIIVVVMVIIILIFIGIIQN